MRFFPPPFECLADFVISVAVVRRNLTFIILLSVLAVSFLLLSLGEFTGNVLYVFFLEFS